MVALAWFAVAGGQASANDTERPKLSQPRPRYPASFAAWIEPARTGPGQCLALKLEVRLEPGWHIYSTTMKEGVGPRKTVISLTETADLIPSAGFEPDLNPTTAFDAALGVTTEFHESNVVWTQILEVPASRQPGPRTVRGTITHQVCSATRCLPPFTFPFEAHFTVKGAAAAESENVEQSSLKRPIPNAGSEGSGTEFDVLRDQRQVTSLLAALGFGFLAGLILNVMPCVLPVISIKAYGFVQHADTNRSQVRITCLAFAAGILFVFLILAALAAFAGLRWGQQFQSDAFVVAMITLLVAFALGMFEVYTIWLPGIVSEAEASTGAREGVAASFTNGMLATVLATPCSGPYLGATLSYALLQPPGVIFAVFTAIGLGMACPYVLLCCSPNLSRFMPRPGEWMNTVKQGMGFLILGTAAWLLWQRRSNGELVVWTVAFSLFVALGMWLYGRWTTPLTSKRKRLAAPVVAAALIGCGAYFCFGLMYPGVPEAPGASRKVANTSSLWQPFSRDKFLELRTAEKTVLVSWTADWCLTCKTLEQVVFNNDEVQKTIREKGIVALRADLTHNNPEAYVLLEGLGNPAHSIPFVAVFCSELPNQPRVLMDWFTKEDLLEILSGCPVCSDPD